MPGRLNVAKARIWHEPTEGVIRAALQGANLITLQFNPESMNLTGGPSMADERSERHQFTDDARYTLTFTTWFDVTASQGADGAESAWDFINRLRFFRTPLHACKNENVPILPALYFQWGSFLFRGQMTGLTTNMEYFSADGQPLRASAAITIVGKPPLSNALAGGGGAAATVQQTAAVMAAKVGQTLQQIASQTGAPWQSLAKLNGIENPRNLAPGKLIKTAPSALKKLIR